MEKRELSYEERLTVKILRENGHTFLQTAKVVRCHCSTCIRIFNSFKKLAQFIKSRELGGQKKLTKVERDLCAELQGRNNSAN